jgi:hypothetical protein
MVTRSPTHLQANRIALAATVAAGVAYVACAAVVAIAPVAALQLLGWLAHVVNVEQFAADVALTPAAFLAGLVEVLVYVYLVVGLFGVTYNGIGKIAERRTEGRARPA